MQGRDLMSKLVRAFCEGREITKEDLLTKKEIVHFLIKGEWFNYDLTPIYKDDIDNRNVLAAVLLGLL